MSPTRELAQQIEVHPHMGTKEWSVHPGCVVRVVLVQRSYDKALWRLLYVAMIVVAGIVYLNDHADDNDSGGAAVVESNLKRNQTLTGFQ